MSSKDQRPEESPEERESRLRSAAMYHAGWIVEGRDYLEDALERIQDTVPGFPRERYEAELDEALDRIYEAQLGVLVREEKMVAEVRELDLSNAVFAIHYFNRRYSGHVSQLGLGRINLGEALGDLYSRMQIAGAVARADALIDEGLRMGVGPRNSEADMGHLRQAHPGFSDRSLGEALDWGHLIHR
ncbi:hypothetical protein [Pseudarthrobacter sp. PvP090]|uniref:hypothetical protein n=1 Tax=Pseudarthrobacter sp. PvP090 TaxID=3156393 RepID=UPI0033926593